MPAVVGQGLPGPRAAAGPAGWLPGPRAARRAEPASRGGSSAERILLKRGVRECCLGITPSGDRGFGVHFLAKEMTFYLLRAHAAPSAL